MADWQFLGAPSVKPISMLVFTLNLKGKLKFCRTSFLLLTAECGQQRAADTKTLRTAPTYLTKAEKLIILKEYDSRSNEREKLNLIDIDEWASSTINTLWSPS